MYYDEVRSGTLFVRFVVTLNRRQLFFSSSQVSRTSTRGSSVRCSIPRICAKQTLKEILQNFMLRLSCYARGAGISPGERTLPTLEGEDEVPNGDSPAAPVLPLSLLVVQMYLQVRFHFPFSSKHVRHWVDWNCCFPKAQQYQQLHRQSQ